MTSQPDTAVLDADHDTQIVNIAAYLFTPLDRLPERRETLRTLCKSLRVKGTILLSPEGINLFMAGSRDSVDELLTYLRSDPLLAELNPKESYSRSQPFSRLLVKLKREIIAFGVEGVEPEKYTSKKIAAKELKQWLDEGRPVTLLDTRNDYEVELGTFENALPIGVDHFRDFPAAVRQLPEDLKEQPIVMFCTGGIRCEKAGPFMEQEGFQDIFQLDGGILKYFEECGGEHYDGDCFVFDHRVALNPQLEETATVQCFACQHPLTVEDQQSDYYKVSVSCPYCWMSPDDLPVITHADRESTIQSLCDPLPGSQPYTNERPLNAPARYDGWTLLDFLCEFHSHIDREQWRRTCDAELIRDRGRFLTADCEIRGGQRLIRLEPDTVEPDVNPNIGVIEWTDDYAVFNKPAPLPIHPCGRFNRNSMSEILHRAFPDVYLKPAHRLDANTTGLIVFSRSREIAKKIQPQFERGIAKKNYLCRVVGHPAWEETVSTQPISNAPAENGFRIVDEEAGDPAETHFRLLLTFENGEALVEAKPVTGRTNQIRVHLWDLGHAIVGDPAYRPSQQLGETQTLTTQDPPMCLHAYRLSLKHPRTGDEIAFETNRPSWADV